MFMQYLNIPANENFLKTLYKYILDTFSSNQMELSNLVVLLPSRRSCNELKKVFLENSDKQAVLLPNIKAIGDISYDELLLEKIDLNVLKTFKEIARPVSNTKYKLLMIKQLLNFNKNLNVGQAINLSRELNKFLNEIISNNLDFDNLKNLVDEEYAEHWQKSLDLLENFGKKWRDYISENNIISNLEYMYKMIELHTNIYKDKAPSSPILIAGNICNIKKTLELVKVLSKYGNTYFVFKGFENVLNENEFKNINEYHSHFCYLNIVKELKIDIKNIKNIENEKIIDDVSRETFYNSFLPAELTYKWHTSNVKANINNVKYIECNDEYEELNIISYYILNYIHNNGFKNIAIITDVDNSRFIENQLKKWNIPCQNTFGNKLIFNELIVFLTLILDTYLNKFDPDYLLGLLKNKYVLLGYKDKDELNNILNIFEEKVLRGKLNNDGLNSYQNRINNLEEGIEKSLLNDFLLRIKTIFSDFASSNLKEFFENHLDIALKLSSDNKNVSRETFFTKAFLDNVNNAKVQDILKEFYENIIDLEINGIEDYIAIFNYIISELSYSSEYSEDNVVNIISTQEARLINYDLIIISNLIDGVLPKNISSDPWMSKQMREKFGFPKKEINIGISNFEFIQYLNQKEVLLTYPLKSNNQPTIESRFLLRLKTYLKLNNIDLKNENIFVECDKYLNSKERILIKRPNPIISLETRPKELSATNIENKLLKNPYDIYCRYVLKLFPKNDINIIKNNIVFGNCIHRILEEYCLKYDEIEGDKYEFLIELGIKYFQEYFFNDETIILLFWDKFKDMAKDFLLKDEEFRKDCNKIFMEQSGKYSIKNYIITAKADRIEEGGDIKIVDYKTGDLPKGKDIKDGKKIQLLIEALIAKNNGFECLKSNNVESIRYWGVKNDEVLEFSGDDLKDLMEKTETMLIKIIDYFNNVENGYKATLKNKDISDYLHLSRVNEWLFNE